VVKIELGNEPLLTFVISSYCSPFYSEVTTSRLCSGTTVASRNIRGGTTLHELTHALSGTTDVGYGCSYDQGLSASNAVRNADNYNVRTSSQLNLSLTATLLNKYRFAIECSVSPPKSMLLLSAEAHLGTSSRAQC
jgi:hypothetical protein